MALQAPYYAHFDPVHPCRRFETRHCPAVYEGVCGDDRPCARFESEDEAPWLPELPDRCVRCRQISTFEALEDTGGVCPSCILAANA